MKVAIIGFGMMGRQIAQVFAQHGHEVEATDEDQQALKTGMDEIANGPYGIHASASKGKLTLEQARGSLAMIKTSPTLDDACKNSDLVIEAAFEDLHLKQNLFQKIESASPPNAMIATNTSTLSLDKISQKISKRDRALGMHFFNPAQLTKLVEIIRGSATSPETVEKGSQIVRELGKTPILAQDEPGFIANRLGLTLYMEASKLLEDGIASLQDIDTCMKLGYNHPMGPFELADFVGLDTRLRNIESLQRATNDNKWIAPKLLREMVQQGYLGDPARKKGSKGGYNEYLQIKR
ncbi:3-hydroxyacyl-CoA dehydrogenase family protein [Candidatus Bathyarchaeota archaeon]|nr:MAG: 3-hydroxyacyl-CoA dehydrogenase family protein [Candidatus Bathyarchaeota archaeon]